MVSIVRHIFSAIFDFIGKHRATIATIECVLIFLFLSGILPLRKSKKKKSLGKKPKAETNIDVIHPHSASRDTSKNGVNFEAVEIPFEKIRSIIRENGIAIYAWKRECYKCHKETTVYSYYIIHDLKKILGNTFAFEHGFELGLGHIPVLDKLVAERFPTASIRQRYSNVEKQSYYANSCSYCGSLQGRYYVVSNPREISNDLWAGDDSMEKYLVETISVPEPIIDEIVEYIIEGILGF